MSRQTETAYQFMKEKIFDGTFRPSQKLIESQLAELIGVSRNTVQKALLKLEQENLVEIETNKGATIKAYTLDEIIHYLEILDVLESLVVKNATHHLAADDMQQLETTVLQMEKCLDQNQLDEYTSLSMSFREIIYKAAKNQKAVELIRGIRSPLRRYQLRTMLLPGIKESSIKEHRKIYDALQKRDEQAVELAVRSDLAMVRESFLQNYQLLL
ncbi:GntR family transcriptional regulator [Brevibacillus nitrificans]|uniref:GntR family transcriptional regulator n=1 Tax=Brevibacillus nitrificans TaxID=651560 RepID=A0A3M8CY40_9BACL|nr:GntR family transcriptional regulator [Brevibacillus nitrificans]RNB80548.1 GntR family transcriptional regulator [Brevibacillus nitrificans]